MAREGSYVFLLAALVHLMAAARIQNAGEKAVTSSFEVAPGTVLVLPIPGTWEATADKTGDEIALRLRTPESEVFVLNVLLGLPPGLRGPSFEVEGLPGTSRLRTMPPSAADVWWTSFLEREREGSPRQYVIYVEAIAGRGRRVFIDTTIRSPQRETAHLTALLEALSGATVEWEPSATAEVELSSQDERRVQLLLARLNVFHEHLKRRRYRASIGMWAEKYSGDEEEVRSDIEEMRRWEAVWRTDRWEVEGIWLAGDRAKVSLLISGRSRTGPLTSVEASEGEREYWIFERGDWFIIPIQLDDFDEQKAVVVPRGVIQRGAVEE